ncbi:SusC/RagA family TonB-linked outer membrane protein [Maribellus comscasis]|uniref:SusC/RagA family TonB-linked outer membrane protein n=1 Tax=Maribellus comscasis TaxID=2681766 RepID=A0A6I6JN01_9BACT|nr:TonB-dependent receptor [Maribellus comscasis]QGY42479.1 SusC/RagA family TonB-linked outer membrane protein [Maribellus comscasis]
MKKKWLLDSHDPGIIKKWGRIMRITVVLIFGLIMTANANSYSQVTKMDIQLTNRTIRDVIAYVEDNSEFVFLYKNEDFNVDKKVNIKLEDATINQILDNVLQGEEVVYDVYDRQIIIRKSDNVPTYFQQQQKNITGIITDNQGLPLPGVSIIVKGTSIGTVSGTDGKFSLSIPNDAEIMQFSFVGMSTVEIPVEGKVTFNVVMEEESIGLDEVVAIGYGSMKKSDLTGSVTSVNSEDFVKGVANNALQLLQGKASGVQISQANSEPGGALSIKVRGAGSINSSNSVLVVIDGLPGADPSSLNPLDIESIEILKDASAAAIYGTRAANGVVLITTKQGSSGTPVVSYNTYFALQTPDYKFDVLDATQYMQMINDISEDGGKTLPFTDQEISAAGKGTDWQDVLMRNAFAMNHQFSINGGSNTSKYYVSLGYLDQDGILISSGLKKYNTLINLEFTPSEKFKFAINLNGALSKKDIIPNDSNSANENADPLNAALQFDPRLTTEKNEQGEYQRNASIALDNPLALAYGYDDNQKNTRISGNVLAEYSIIDGLKASVRLGTNLYNSRYDSYKDRTTEKGKSSGGIGSITTNDNSYWMFEGLLNYDKYFNQVHHISVMGGATWEEFENLSQYSYAAGFLSDVTNTNLLSSGIKETYDVSSSRYTHALQSIIARLNYVYNEKYLLTATLRRDGSSRFSEDNKYAIFPSVAVGWRLSEESFIKEIPAISQLKLRFGYGQMGNEGINNFETIQTFVSGGNTILGGSELSGAQPARIPNSELTWETTEEYNIGLDYGVLQNRISGGIEYYVKNTKDQLFNKPVPASTGFTSVRTNFGNVRNSGIDFNINTENLVGAFSWRTNLTFSTLKNEVIKLPPFVGDIITTGSIGTFTQDFALVQEGSPMRAFYGYKVVGIFQENDDIANSAQPNANPGEPIFLDYDEDGNIDSDDRVVLGKPFPDLTFSLNNSFSYKNFNLEIYIMGVKGIETLNSNVIESLKPINFDRNIMSEHYTDRWTPENPGAEYPSGVNSSIYFNGGKVINSYSVQDASFLRVKNITLGYDIPLKNFNLFKSASVYISGENLLTFTKFEGFDPDANQSGTGVVKTSYNNYPLAKVFRIGANIKF